jgi:hypothetical protein
VFEQYRGLEQNFDLVLGQDHRQLLRPFYTGKLYSKMIYPINTVEIAKPINSVFKKTIRWGLVLILKIMKVVKNLFAVQFNRTTLKVQRHMGQTATIVGQGALAFTGDRDRTFQFLISL